jgi:hypothetical protein
MSGYYLHLVTGVVCTVISLMWMLHIVLYMFFDPPITPFLNSYFQKMDDAFGGADGYTVPNRSRIMPNRYRTVPNRYRIFDTSIISFVRFVQVHPGTLHVLKM